MNIEQLCCNLELATKLRDLGYPQGGNLFWWALFCVFNPEGLDRKWGLVSNSELESSPDGKYHDFVASPTAGELGEWLPDEYEKDKYFVTYKCRELYYCETWPTSSLGFWDKTEANARALTVIHLLESGKGKGER